MNAEQQPHQQRAAHKVLFIGHVRVSKARKVAFYQAADHGSGLSSNV